MTVDIIIEAARWDQLGLADLAQTAAQAALEYFALDPACFSISALGGNDARIAELNASFRGNAAATNVLSWPSLERAARCTSSGRAASFASGRRDIRTW